MAQGVMIQRPGIFRIEALRYHHAHMDEQVLPSLPPTRLFAWLWIALLAIGLYGLWFARRPVPAYVTGTALLLDGKRQDMRGRMLVVLASGKLAALQRGTAVIVRDSLDQFSRRRYPIIHVEPRLVTPAELRDWFGVSATSGAVLRHPKAVALIDYTPDSAQWRTERLRGVFEIRVVVGSRPAIALLPGVRSMVGP